MKYLVRIVAVMLLVVLAAGSIGVKADAELKPLEKKILYLTLPADDGTDGAEVKQRDTVKYSKLLGITGKQARKLKVTAVSSDESIAVCDDENRKVHAAGMGTATVTLTCGDTDIDVRITVKKNAQLVYFGRDFAGDLSEKVFETGVDYELSLPRNKGGVRLDTDKRRLIITNSKGKDVTGKVAKSSGTRLWTVRFTSAGEYTLTGEAFQSDKHPDTTLSAQLSIKVVEPEPPFSAAPSGVYTIKLTGGEFTADMPYTVKRGFTEISVAQNEVAKNGKSVTLTLDNRISDGTYTVSDGEHTATFEAQEEYAAELVIYGKDGQVLVNEDRTKAYVNYDILNQYGESARRRFYVTWNSSFGSLTNDDRKRGILEFSGGSGNTLTYGYPMAVTGVVMNGGASDQAQFTGGSTRFADKVEVLGIVDLRTRKILKKVPADFKSGEYGICFKMLDANGFEIEYSEERADDLTVMSMDMLTVGITYEGNSVLVDDEYYAYAVITPGYYAKNGGNTQVRFMSTKTGGDTLYTLKAAGGQVVQSFRILPYDGIITELKSSATDSDAYTLEFEALDADGEPVTEFKDLAGAVRLLGSGLKLIEANDGTAKLKYLPKNLGATYNAPVSVYLSATVAGSGFSDGILMEVRERRRPVAVRSLVKEKPLYVVNGYKYYIYKVKDDGDYSYLDYYDQYGDKLTWKALGDYPGYSVNCVGYDENIIDSVTERDSNKGFDFAIKDHAVSRSDTAYFEFAVFDENNNEIPGSRNKVALEIVDITAFSHFEMKCDKSYTLKNNDDSGAEFSVTGVLYDGTKITIPNKYIRYSRPEETVNGVSHAAVTYESATGTYYTWGPAYSAASGALSSFLDYSSTNPDGTHPDRLFEARFEARIFCLSGGAIDTDRPVGSASMTKNVGDFDRKMTKLNTETSDRTHVKWISTSKKRAYILAENGVISNAALKEAIEYTASKRGTDNYGKSRTIQLDNITVEISGYTENTSALYSDINSDTGSYRVVYGTGGISIVNAEIGDKFTATYRYTESSDNEVSVEVSFTVGADKYAYIDESGTVPAWY